jgi:glycyl-tRNA synthetase
MQPETEQEPRERDRMRNVISLCKRLGFVYPSGEIYGGLQSAWDYGPLGVELKRNIADLWWNEMVRTRNDVVGVDSAIITHPGVWEASGHLRNFHDPLVDCRQCRSRFRADQVPGSRCPECGGELTEPRDFGLMFKTFMGPVEDESAVVYLRPETCQSIFTHFQNIVTSTRLTVPFGVAQIGKAFRNEITVRNFIFRSREFEQMEMEFFCRPEDTGRWYEYWIDRRLRWYTEILGIRRENLRLRPHEKSELAHYAAGCTDIEYRFPFAGGEGFGELEGIADRTDYDLSAHMNSSGKDLRFHDTLTGEKFVPHVVETSGGVGRTFLAVLLDAYRTEEVEGRERVVLSLDRKLAPVKVAVLPLSRKLSEEAEKIEQALRPHWPVLFDVTGSIGKRYRRNDEIGTPFCITLDFDSLTDRKVTIRDRDSLGQIRVDIDNIVEATARLMAEGWTE